ncbi:hypothetical protein DUNSADRAFT_7936, partial [Dunaliella salina]
MKPHSDEVGLEAKIAGLQEDFDVESGSQGPASCGEKQGKESDGGSPAKKQAPQPQSCNGNVGAVGTLTLLRKYPHLLLASAILFCLVVALCAFGIVHATNASYHMEETKARDQAVRVSDAIAKQLSSASQAALSLAAVVKTKPHWSFIEDNFLSLAKELFRQSQEDQDNQLDIKEVALAPFGRIRLDYSLPAPRNASRDLFSAPYVQILGTFRSVEERGLSITGPIPLTDSNGSAFSAFSA